MLMRHAVVRVSRPSEASMMTARAIGTYRVAAAITGTNSGGTDAAFCLIFSSSLSMAYTVG